MNMTNISEIKDSSLFNQMQRFTVGDNPHHARIRHIDIDQQVLEQFFEQTRTINSQNLEYVPYMRDRKSVV